jgi:hypothetical protein
MIKDKSHPHFVHCSVKAKVEEDKITRRQTIERYRRLLKTTTEQWRRDYLLRLIREEEQKQKDAGDSNYPY